MVGSKVIITGATGNAGSAIVSAAIASPSISQITVLSRRPPYAPADTNPKVRYVQLPSADFPRGFEEYPEGLMEKLKGNDAVIWALGVSQNDVSKEEYIKITLDYTLTAARAFSTLGTPEKPFRFIYMSGLGARQDENTWTLFGKIKGRAEKTLMTMRSERFEPLIVRPGGIVPEKDTQANVKWWLSVLAPAVGALTGRAIYASDLAKACVGLATDAGKKGWEVQSQEGWIDNAQLKQLAQHFKNP